MVSASSDIRQWHISIPPLILPDPVSRGCGRYVVAPPWALTQPPFPSPKGDDYVVAQTGHTVRDLRVCGTASLLHWQVEMTHVPAMLATESTARSNSPFRESSLILLIVSKHGAIA